MVVPVILWSLNPTELQKLTSLPSPSGCRLIELGCWPNVADQLHGFQDHVSQLRKRLPKKDALPFASPPTHLGHTFLNLFLRACIFTNMLKKIHQQTISLPRATRALIKHFVKRTGQKGCLAPRQWVPRCSCTAKICSQLPITVFTPFNGRDARKPENRWCLVEHYSGRSAELLPV